MKAWNAYRERSYNNLATLAQGFGKYCEIPSDCLSFVPLKEKFDRKAKYTLVAATHFDFDDHYWHVGLLLILRESPNEITPDAILLEFAIRENGGKMLVKRGKEDTPREINLSDQEDCENFYASVAEGIKAFYGNPDGPSPDDRTPRRIGFR
jgi:hypothetical protein